MYVDEALSRRLERTEGNGVRAFVEARQQVHPTVRATWTDVAGALAAFDGAESPITQCFGLGLQGEVTTPHLEELEDFFLSREAPVMHEVSPLAHDSARSRLVERGYHPIEFTSVMFRSLANLQDVPRATVPVRPVAANDRELWIQVAAEGWSEFPEFAPFMRSLSEVTVSRQDMTSYLAWMNEVPVATGSLAMTGAVGLLAGASTIPSARGRGAQTALLATRLRDAAAAGCDIAMMCARPGSGSQRNAERNGFRIAYTRIKWLLPFGTPGA